MFNKILIKTAYICGVGVFTLTGVLGPLYILGTSKKDVPETWRAFLAGCAFGASAYGYVRCGDRANEIKLR